MADNTQLSANVGSGDICSTDDIGGGVKVQRVKAQYGPDGTGIDVSLTTPLPTRKSGATSTVTSVNDNAASVTLLASAATRMSAEFTNDSGAIAYLKKGATASTTSYTKKMLPDETYKIDDYTGVVDCIWASAPGGAMRITEVTP